MPSDRTSRRIVPGLQRDRYPSTYVELDGGHVALEATLAEAITWWLDAARPARDLVPASRRSRTSWPPRADPALRRARGFLLLCRMPPTPARDVPGPHPENQRKRRELRGPRRALIGLLTVSAGLAVLGGLALIIVPTARLFHQPVDVLFASSLTSLRGTGLVLVVVIGGTQALAAALLIGHRVRARMIALGAALIAAGWGLVQMMTAIDGVTWFQLLAFGVGALEAFLVAGCTPRGRPAPNRQLRHR